MGRTQGKNALNTTKSGTAPPQTSASIATRPDYPNTDETKENITKNNFMKMAEALKWEMSLPAVEGCCVWDLRFSAICNNSQNEVGYPSRKMTTKLLGLEKIWYDKLNMTMWKENSMSR